MIFSSAEIINFLPAVLNGKVVDAVTGNPVISAHVYITKGEEETFTCTKGEFTLSTWNKFPVPVLVEHQSYKSWCNHTLTSCEFEIKLTPEIHKQ